MPKYKIVATLTRTYELTLEGDGEMDAWEKTYDWIYDDFDEYEVDAVWNWDVVEETNNA